MIFMPIPLLSASFFFPTAIFLLATIPIFTLLPGFPMPSMSNYNARPRRLSSSGAFLDQTLAFGVIGSDPMLGIYRCASLSCF